MIYLVFCSLIRTSETPFRRYFRSKKQKNIILFGFLLTYSYLCTRFPRNRWQEVTSCLLCCAWNDNNNFKRLKENGFN